MKYTLDNLVRDLTKVHTTKNQARELVQKYTDGLIEEVIGLDVADSNNIMDENYSATARGVNAIKGVQRARYYELQKGK